MSKIEIKKISEDLVEIQWAILLSFKIIAEIFFWNQQFKSLLSKSVECKRKPFRVETDTSKIGMAYLHLDCL